MEGIIGSTLKEFISQSMAIPVAAMNVIIQHIKLSKALTWMQLELEIRQVIQLLKNCPLEDLGGQTSISLISGCDLFMKHVTRAFDVDMNFAACKQELLRRGERMVNTSINARSHIANIGHTFVQDNCTILVHGYSRVVTALILKAADSKYFNVFITEGKPDIKGTYAMAKILTDAGIPTKIILDSSVGAIIESVSFCLVGAEGVMENGGIVNKVGTYQIALVAQALKKPFYVAVESYKFARMYPMSQSDIQDMLHSSPQVKQTLPNTTSSKVNEINQSSSAEEKKEIIVSSNDNNPWHYDVSKIDFTPAKLISLLFTNLGILTPAAVSDELIRLYQ